MMFDRYRRDRLFIALYRYSPFRLLVQSFVRRRDPDIWAFVMGCYNSGTTLLQRLIASHPEVSSLRHEGVLYARDLIRPEDFGWTRMWCMCTDKISLPAVGDPLKANRIIRDWSPFFEKGVRIYLEKSISNLPRARWIYANFDSARFILIVRNPFAVAAGIRKKARPSGEVRKLYGDSYPIELPARQWLESGQMILELVADSKIPTHLVRYEDLVANPVATLTGVFTFLNLTAAEGEFSDSKMSSFGYTERLENRNMCNIAELSLEERYRITEIVGKTAQDLGYKLNS